MALFSISFSALVTMGTTTNSFPISLLKNARKKLQSDLMVDLMKINITLKRLSLILVSDTLYFFKVGKCLENYQRLLLFGIFFTSYFTSVASIVVLLYYSCCLF